MRFLRNGSVLSLTTLVLVATPATAQPQPDPTIESLVAQATARLAAVQVPGAAAVSLSPDAQLKPEQLLPNQPVLDPARRW